MVTCFACHRGGDHPRTTPDLSALYGGTPEDELDDTVEQAPGAPSADDILDRYVQALGGAQQLASVASFVAEGTSSGYGPESEKRPIEIFAQAQGQRTVIIHTDNGDSTTTYDGRAGWIAAPLRPVAVVPLTGGDLDGARLDAALSFPARVKQAVVGSGRASKFQMARTVMSLLGHGRPLQPDEADAAGVALCHAFTWRE